MKRSIGQEVFWKDQGLVFTGQVISSEDDGMTCVGLPKRLAISAQEGEMYTGEPQAFVSTGDLRNSEEEARA